MKMMSAKYYFLFSILVSILILLPCFACAEFVARSSMISPRSYDYPTPIALVTSVDQYYSILFGDEGEAIVSVVITIRNSDIEPISHIKMGMPGSPVNIITAVQEIPSNESQKCNYWIAECIVKAENETCIQYDSNGNCAKYEKPCLETNKVCGSYGINYEYLPKYQKVNIGKTTADWTSIKLGTHISQNEEVKLLIIYKVDDYTEKIFGGNNFEVRTAKFEYLSSTVRVAVNVKEKLHLRGGTSGYYYSDFSRLSRELIHTSIISERLGKDLFNYINQITNMGGLVKTTSYLEPGERFSVKGSYSKSWLRIYWLRSTFIGLLLISIIGGCIIGIRKLIKYTLKHLPKRKKSSKKKHEFIIPCFTGLFSALAIIFIWAISFIIIVLMTQSVNIGFIQPLLIVLINFLAVLLTLTLLIGIPIYIGMKFGVWTGVFTIAALLSWLIISVAILVLILAVLGNSIFI